MKWGKESSRRGSQRGGGWWQGESCDIVDNFQASGFFPERDKELLEDSELSCGKSYLKEVILAARRD